MQNFADIISIAVELCGTDKITYLLDEIQNVQYWERWVNNLHTQGIKVFATGSNAYLLSSEISTYLTGRNKPITMFPFSFMEYLRLKHVEPFQQITSTKKSLINALFRDYLLTGGFPTIVKTGDIELSKQYVEDIINKDILSRYQIRQIKEIKDLLLYLCSNTAKTYSYATLKKVSGIKSLSTIKRFIDYYQSVYILFTVGRFDYSLTKQKVSSAKPYIGDTSFLKTISFTFSENIGACLENAVFLHLLRTRKQIFYHYDKKECDFVIKEGLHITQAIQVTVELSHPETKTRELDGLYSAMTAYKLKDGLILTLDHEETLLYKNKRIVIKPAWKWMLGI